MKIPRGSVDPRHAFLEQREFTLEQNHTTATSLDEVSAFTIVVAAGGNASGSATWGRAVSPHER